MKRVPVLLQMTPTECGAACLAMVLTYYGRETTINECRRVLQSGRDGLTARVIAQGARSMGLDVRAFSMAPDALAEVPLPAIVHWNFDHFLVVERWSPQQVHVVDPAMGRRRLTSDEFSAGFTGVVLTMAPGAAFQPGRSPDKLSWRVYFRDLIQAPGAKRVLAQILAASALLQVLGLIFPLFTMVLVDHILPAQAASMLTILGVGMVILVLAQVVLGYLRDALALYLEVRLDTQMMLGFFAHVLNLPFRFFQERSSGDLLMRLGSISVIREVLTGETVAALLDGAMALFYLVVLLIWEPIFGLLALLFGGLQALVLLASSRRLYELTERDLAAQAESQSYLVEALAGVGTLKATASEDRALGNWSNLFIKQLNVSIRRSHLGNLIDTGQDLIGTLAPIVLLWLGGMWVLNGAMTLGVMLAVVTLATSFLDPLSSLVATAQGLHLLGANLDRIADVLKSAPEQDEDAVSPAPTLTGALEVRDVSFRYHATAPWALRDVAFRVRPGQKIAVVGRTGSGKSTLGLLLLGLYRPDEGDILYDCHSLATMELRSLRRQIGVVLQEPALFSGSIRQNIALHDPQVTTAQIEAAARLAAIHDEIIALPMGYETIIAEGGTDLSGGQRQRICLARALVQRPAVLLLDEATSDLDAVTESMVDRNLNDLVCTRIVIAHRLSTVRNADLILMLDDGFIVEQGTHDELLALGTAYADLVRDQEAGMPQSRGIGQESVSFGEEA
ncbi:MAG: peptidase domain-containing ABC transporter [Caldilineaceae bacterium]